MREIGLFVEDNAHLRVIGGLIQRIADAHSIPVTLYWLNSEGGHGNVVSAFRAYLRDLAKQGRPLLDLIIVATDANCRGINERIWEITRITDMGATSVPPIVQAIPDPHIERWLLLDGAAFSRLFGTGCDAPDQKCDRKAYKSRLIRAFRNAGIRPQLGGIEYAQDIVQAMDLDRAKRADHSLQLFLDNLANQFRQWSQQPAP